MKLGFALLNPTYNLWIQDYKDSDFLEMGRCSFASKCPDTDERQNAAD